MPQPNDPRRRPQQQPGRRPAPPPANPNQPRPITDGAKLVAELAKTGTGREKLDVARAYLIQERAKGRRPSAEEVIGHMERSHLVFPATIAKAKALADFGEYKPNTADDMAAPSIEMLMLSEHDPDAEEADTGIPEDDDDFDDEEDDEPPPPRRRPKRVQYPSEPNYVGPLGTVNTDYPATGTRPLLLDASGRPIDPDRPPAAGTPVQAVQRPVTEGVRDAEPANRGNDLAVDHEPGGRGRPDPTAPAPVEGEPGAEKPGDKQTGSMSVDAARAEQGRADQRPPDVKPANPIPANQPAAEPKNRPGIGPQVPTAGDKPNRPGPGPRPRSS